MPCKHGIYEKVEGIQIKSLVATYGRFSFPPNTPGVKVKTPSGETDYFLHICNIGYNQLKPRAVKIGMKLVASKMDLIVLKAVVGFYEDKKYDLIPSPKARGKAFKDLEILVASLGNFAPD